jgi:predicted dehydrogenase
MLLPGDIRFRYELGGGALMDTGCYTVSIVRFLAGAEPEVVSAESRLSSADVDRSMCAELRFADGRSGRITCSLFSSALLKLSARVEGDEGVLSVFNPIVPQFYNRLKLVTRAGTTTQRVRGDASYVGQLRAFVRAVRGGEPMATDGAHGVANMRVIDAIYDAAGMKRRGAVLNQ